MNNSLVNNKKPKFSVILKSNTMQELINNTFKDTKRANNFIANVSSLVANNPKLQDCDPFTIISSAMTADQLNLSTNVSLGQAYVLPFNDRKLGRTVATFQLGYRGYIQLALRSGFYKKLNVTAIKEGELVKVDEINEEFQFKTIENYEQRKNAKTIGYYAFFEYVNGFRKAIYWSKERMQAHASQYSAGYKAQKGYTFWEKDFDSMGMKTMIRQLISKWGVMSIELQKAFEADISFKDETGKVSYFDSANDQPEDAPIESHTDTNEQEGDIVDQYAKYEQQNNPSKTDSAIDEAFGQKDDLGF